jgi:5-methylcytosine-specific restriction protein B
MALETSIGPDKLRNWLQAIERKGQAVMYGPPGTGKTYIAERLARHLVAGGDGFVELVQFHPAYSYEEFIQGIRPESDDKGALQYSMTDGRFVEFCSLARARRGVCVLIIDEINRANISRVFGELMYLLEYRDKWIPLAGGSKFAIPENVRIIGTMNTADRSIALVDFALRRRFAFLELEPMYDVLRGFHAGDGACVEKLIPLLEEINTKIGDRNYWIGISFFLVPHLSDSIEEIWRMEIEPYLEEYFFSHRETADRYRWEVIRTRLEV